MTMRNDPLRTSIQDLNSNSESASRIDFYRLLPQGFLLLAVAEVPAGVGVAGSVLEKDTRLSILTTTTPDGETAILAFTDIESLHAYSPGVSYASMRSIDVLDTVVNQGLDALILNAAGPWVVVPRTDILRIMQTED